MTLILSTNGNHLKYPRRVGARLTSTTFIQRASTSILQRRNKHNSSREEIHYDSNRDVSPYRIENFIDVLNQFGISNTSIMKKLMNSPMTHINFGQDIVSNMQSDITQLLSQVPRHLAFLFSLQSFCSEDR